MVAPAAHPAIPFRIIGDNRSAIAHGSQILARVETERRRLSQGSGRIAVVSCPVRLRRVLEYRFPDRWNDADTQDSTYPKNHVEIAMDCTTPARYPKS